MKAEVETCLPSRRKGLCGRRKIYSLFRPSSGFDHHTASKREPRKGTLNRSEEPCPCGRGRKPELFNEFAGNAIVVAKMNGQKGVTLMRKLPRQVDSCEVEFSPASRRSQ